jgi:hypothetical protein
LKHIFNGKKFKRFSHSFSVNLEVFNFRIKVAPVPSVPRARRPNKEEGSGTVARGAKLVSCNESPEPPEVAIRNSETPVGVSRFEKFEIILKSPPLPKEVVPQRPLLVGCPTNCLVKSNVPPLVSKKKLL